MDSLRVYLITGLSGAGKSQAIQAFEDMGLYCVDNLPSEMVEGFLEYCRSRSGPIPGVALVIDVRGEGFVDEFPDLLDRLNREDVKLKTLFLEASSNVLLNRYKESRRPHPLGEKYTLEEAIEAERDRLTPVREKADFVIDTSRITTHQFRGMLKDLHHPDDSTYFTISLTSFGFKHGVPAHVDTLFDARFLPNPHYDSELKNLTGIDRSVEEFFEDSKPVERYLEQLKELLEFMVEEYTKEGKELLSVGIGCTGGRHRSVYLVQKLSSFFEGNDKTRTIVTHRDLQTSNTDEPEVGTDR
jgi:UPF0042 nucleotide-binding protein